MDAILVFIDGTICDTRNRIRSRSDRSPEADFNEDLPVPGSVEALQELGNKYLIMYMGARSTDSLRPTKEWLRKCGFPEGPVFLGSDQAERLEICGRIGNQYSFLAGIGDRWDDNALHHELNCISIIVQEYGGDWGSLPARLVEAHRRKVIRENRIHLQGKIEGLFRVLPVLQEKYGEALWDAWMETLQDRADRSRSTRQAEELALFESHHLDPHDLRDAAKLDAILREQDWEHNRVYGLQDFELVEATKCRYVHKVTRCAYAKLWKENGQPGIGYQMHCRTDRLWWHRPAWNERVSFEQPQTLMQGAEYCLFIQTLSQGDEPED